MSQLTIYEISVGEFKMTDIYGADNTAFVQRIGDTFGFYQDRTQTLYVAEDITNADYVIAARTLRRIVGGLNRKGATAKEGLSRFRLGADREVDFTAGCGARYRVPISTLQLILSEYGD